VADPDLIRYVRENRDRYTDDAIREQLLQAGHSPEEVGVAFTAADGAAPVSGGAAARSRGSWSATLRRPLFWVALIATGVFLFGTALLFPVWIVNVIDPGASTRVRVAGAFISSIVGLAVAAWVARSRNVDPAIARGAATAFAILLIPLVIWIGVLGLCLLGPTR